jgi:hypothetical protein
MANLGLAELQIIAFVTLLTAIPVAVVVWIAVSLRRSQHEQHAIRERLDQLEEQQSPTS